MDSDIILQIVAIFGGLVATLGGALFFIVKAIVKNSREDVRQLIAAFGKATEGYEKSQDLFKRAIESVEIGQTRTVESTEKNTMRIQKLRKEVQELKEMLTKCA